MRAALARRGPDALAGLDAVIELDGRRRALLPELEGLRAEQNEANERIRSTEDARCPSGEIEAMRTVAARVKELERGRSPRWRSASRRRLRRCRTCPIRAPRRVPRTSWSRERGRSAELDFEPRDHLELAGEMIDMDHGREPVGVALCLPAGDLVMVELALVRWVLHKLRAMASNR